MKSQIKYLKMHKPEKPHLIAQYSISLKIVVSQATTHTNFQAFYFVRAYRWLPFKK